MTLSSIDGQIMISRSQDFVNETSVMQKQNERQHEAMVARFNEIIEQEKSKVLDTEQTEKIYLKPNKEKERGESGEGCQPEEDKLARMLCGLPEDELTIVSATKIDIKI